MGFKHMEAEADIDSSINYPMPGTLLLFRAFFFAEGLTVLSFRVRFPDAKIKTSAGEIESAPAKVPGISYCS